MPLERFCDWNQIMDLVNIGGKLAWHGKSHKNLTKLSYDEIVEEVTPPFLMNYFAYPHGKFNSVVIDILKKAGFKQAFSVNRGANSEYRLLRKYL